MPTLANPLTEVDNFDSTVGQLETTTPVQGGPGGEANQQAQALANRTRYLLNRMNGGDLFKFKSVDMFSTSISLTSADVGKSYFLDPAATSQKSVGFPASAGLEDGAIFAVAHIGGTGSVEINAGGSDYFPGGLPSWFLLNPMDMVIFALDKGVSSSQWVPVAYTAKPIPTGWTTATLSSGNVTVTGGAIASGFSGKIRYKFDGNIMHFRGQIVFTATTNTVSGVAIDISAFFLGASPSPNFYIHLGSGDCSGFSTQSLINGGAEIINISTTAGQFLSQGSNVVLLSISGHAEGSTP